ncbi:CoA transferase [Candidatus Bathyarchaeota archaeon]|nr:MAG: CoA transferase [Candidatus Bathyarchaeota archaeon]
MKKPLEGIRVLDLTHVWFGPICTMFLAGLGAEVIKIEPPWGSIGRFGGGVVLKGNVGASFIFLNRQKKGMTLNLKTEKGKEIFKKLVEISDIVVENYVPGTMERLGLGYETLKRINPRIIMASGSGYGQYGPWSRRPSFDLVGRATSGVTWVSKHPDEPPRMPADDAFGDTIPGLFLLIGILVALRHRDLTGEGQWVDVAQADAMLSILNSFTMWHLAHVTFPQVTGAVRGGPSRIRIGGYYKAKDGWVLIGGAISGKRYDSLVKIVGKGDLLDESGVKKIADWVAERTCEEVVDALSKGGVIVAKVLSLEEVAENPQLRAREMIVEMEHPHLGRIRTTGFPIKFTTLKGAFTEPEPMLGQHNEEILTKLLGYSREEVAKLKEEGII